MRVEIINTKGEILKYTTPLLNAIPLGLKEIHIANINPEKEKLTKQKHINDFIKFVFLPNDTATIETAIKIFTNRETIRLCLGINMYNE